MEKEGKVLSTITTAQHDAEKVNKNTISVLEK